MTQTEMKGLLFFAVMLLVGCSTAGLSSNPADAAEDLAEMKERILELQERAAMAEVEIDRLRQQVTGLEERLEATGSSSERMPEVIGGSDPSRGETRAPQTGGLIAEEAVEESDLIVEPTPPAVAERSFRDGGAAQSISAEAPTKPSGGESALLQTVEPAAQALYDRGYTLFHQARYLDAEASFQRFLQAYPQTELSDNAQFWIGESRFSRGDVPGALAAFRETLQRYPEGNKIPDALIKEGDCLEMLGDHEGARSRYQEAMRRFPNSAAAVMAEERLAGLD